MIISSLISTFLFDDHIYLIRIHCLVLWIYLLNAYNSIWMCLRGNIEQKKIKQTRALYFMMFDERDKTKKNHIKTIFLLSFFFWLLFINSFFCFFFCFWVKNKLTKLIFFNWLIFSFYDNIPPFIECFSFWLF